MSFNKSPLLAFFLLAASAVPLAAQVSPHLFNLSATGGIISEQPWPVVSFSGLRLLGNNTSWGEVNTAKGVYNFTDLDLWLAAAHDHGQDVLYTFIWVPQWISSNPNDSICRQGPGTCDPPKDLNADGTGTDQLWKDFVTALTEHNKNSVTGHITYWEMWNEPHNNFFWNGTNAQLVRMVKDAYAIIKNSDPNAVVLSPTLAWSNLSWMQKWITGYLAAGGNKYVDAISTHGYVFQQAYPSGKKTDNPETMVALIPIFKTLLKPFGLDSKQIFNAETSWSINGRWGPYSSDPDLQSAFLARLHLLHAANGIARLYWFQWNDTTDGTLWIPDPNDPRAQGTIQKAGIAYQQIYNWMVGKTLPQGCSQSGTVWTCSISGPKGYVAEAVWDTAQNCSNGTCTHSIYKTGAPFIRYRDLDGATTNIQGGTVPIGAKPILLEN